MLLRPHQSIALGPLDQAATAQLAGEVAEHPLDETALARTFRETEGHPLFIVERGHMELARQPEASGDNALPRVQSVVAKMHHFAWTTTPTVVQISLEGPFDIFYVSPADDPQKPLTKR